MGPPISLGASGREVEAHGSVFSGWNALPDAM
jgi:hypothetical protein